MAVEEEMEAAKTLVVGEYLATFAFGLFAWTFLEYTIHGILSHIFKTFATPLHYEHHRDPHAVFSAGAWLPFGLVSLIVFGIFGLTPKTTIWLGIITGFLGYEFLHYRIHFARPLCAIEDRLRTRHLAHHFRAPNQIFGVTNRIWDRAFGSEPEEPRLAQMQATVAMIQPLSGPSNFRLIFRPWFYLSRYHFSSHACESSAESVRGRHRRGRA
jgi:sterol desaturase/sphingolipid hydroxylase (fatty acid hydroxylase superfamily)